MTALFVFDMDGTLLPGSTASLELAGALGALDDLHALEARFTAGDLDTRGFAAAVQMAEPIGRGVVGLGAGRP